MGLSLGLPPALGGLLGLNPGGIGAGCLERGLPSLSIPRLSLTDLSVSRLGLPRLIGLSLRRLSASLGVLGPGPRLRLGGADLRGFRLSGRLLGLGRFARPRQTILVSLSAGVRLSTGLGLGCLRLGVPELHRAHLGLTLLFGLGRGRSGPWLALNRPFTGP